MITGQKRVGKTSLVKVFLSELSVRPDVLTLYVPLGMLSAATGSDDLGRLGKDLVEMLAEEYEGKFSKALDLPIPTVGEFRDSFNAAFSRFLRRLRRAQALRLAVAIDDFDELPTPLYSGDTGKAFFLALRALIDDGISFFFIGSERLPTVMHQHAERLNQVRQVPVDYLDPESLSALVREPVEGWLEYQADAIEEIAVWSARNPYFATLICDAIWEQAVRKRDYWIVRYDVDVAVQGLAEKSQRNSYQHFWSDSPLAEEEDRDLFETKSSFIVLAISKHQSSPLSFVSRKAIITDCEGLSQSDADRHLQELIKRNVLEVDLQNHELVRFRVPLFALWLKLRGRTEVREAQVIRGRLGTLEELGSEELVTAARELSYRDRPLTPHDVAIWVSQFGRVSDQRLMLILLNRLRDRGLFTPDKFQFALTQLHKFALREATSRDIPQKLSARNRLANWYVTHADPPGKSGSHTLYEYRATNPIPSDNSGSPDRVISALVSANSNRAVLVCIDDFVGTGRSAVQGLKERILPLLEEKIPNWREWILLIYAVVVAYEEGLDYIQSNFGNDISVVCFQRQTEADKAFSPQSSIFESAEDRFRAQDIAKRIGDSLERRHPLGYEDSQALIVFPNNVPNNTLPIFCKADSTYQGRPWTPLFPRS